MKVQVFARYSLLVVVTFVAQLGFFGGLKLGGVHPDITLLLPVATGMVAGPRRGALIGFCIGLLMDPMWNLPFGFTALSWTLAGAGSGWAEETINAHSQLGLSVLAGACSAGAVVMFAVTGQLFGLDTLNRAELGRIVGVLAALNGLLAIAAVSAVEWAERPSEAKSHW